jgi:hypothetical protein
MRVVGQFDGVFSWFPPIRQADPPLGARFDCLIICWASLKSCISAGRGGGCLNMNTESGNHSFSVSAMHHHVQIPTGPLI